MQNPGCARLSKAVIWWKNNTEKILGNCVSRWKLLAKDSI